MPRKAPNPTDQYVGSRVRLRRQHLGISQEKLATGLDLSCQQIQKYENGTNRVGSSRLAKIAAALQVPVARLFDEAMPTADGPLNVPRVAELLATPHAIPLLEAFAKISEESTRRAIARLVGSIADQR